ncbi:efflux RND transporter periplasmic adaptor subunit [Putridiphycobacter roseus]|uniref:Efflux RND transporter periplasmic adaptor subunit n=1 Tax=Putridiphycobacter roseus TaxID=2219161 RepID=A0A2W1MXV0_9FLAO|nr:efflux RND transporter periplasmic adaptor subunit [Putridiphycobacter roseus]PZE16204.1 efflux RND transporter periplasmic adaptor subunit [Putridiphycobacter roseus]
MKKSLMVISLFALLFQTSCKTEKEEGHEAEGKFLVTSPIRKDTTILQDYVSQIHAISHIEIRAQERGFLQDIYIDEGQSVKKGQLLFKIMPKLYQAEYESAEAEADFAEIEFQNASRLADSNIISSNRLALAKAKFNKAKAELSMAQVHLSFTDIRAPFDGIIDRFHVRLGSLIDEGDLMTNLSDNSKMWVYFNVSESEYLDYRTKLKGDSVMIVSLQLANGALFDYQGRVETIEADFNNETGNIAFRATFPNPKGLLRHGETGSVLVTKPLVNALLIPQVSTFEILEQKYVYVIDKEDVVQARKIKIGTELPHLYAVVDGLEEGDLILLDGLRKVKAGDKIEYDFKDPKTVISNLDLYAE